MMMVLSPTYRMTVTIKDKMPQTSGAMGSGTAQASMGAEIRSPYKFGDTVNGKTGCDEALAAVKKALADAGLDAQVFFDQFSHS